MLINHYWINYIFPLYHIELTEIKANSGRLTMNENIQQLKKNRKIWFIFLQEWERKNSTIDSSSQNEKNKLANEYDKLYEQYEIQFNPYQDFYSVYEKLYLKHVIDVDLYNSLLNSYKTEQWKQ